MRATADLHNSIRRVRVNENGIRALSDASPPLRDTTGTGCLLPATRIDGPRNVYYTDAPIRAAVAEFRSAGSMRTYQSRYQQRRQTVITGKIGDIERYDRYYDIAYEALRDGRFPHLTVPVGTLLVRVMGGAHNPREIPPDSSRNPDNRFSGPRPDGRPGQGALYVGTITGVLREHAHYALLRSSSSPLQGATPALWKPGSVDQTRTFMQDLRAGAAPPKAATKYYLFRLIRPLRFADLRITSLAPMFARLRSDGGGSRFAIAGSAPLELQISAANASQDYSAARGIADAVFDSSRVTGDAGVCAFSSRADLDSGLVAGSAGDPTGGLVFAIFGPDKTAVTALEVVPADPKDKSKLGFDTFAALSAAIK